MAHASTTTFLHVNSRALRTTPWREYVIYMAFVVIFGIFAITLGGQGFTSAPNLLNILRQTAPISIMAVAMTFVIGSAQIDLSIGALAGLTSVVTALVLARFGLAAGIAAGVATGFAVGALNGSLVAFAGIPSFLVTLGTLSVIFGGAQWVTQTLPVPVSNDVYNNVFGGGDLGPVPSLILWSAAVAILGHVVLRKTVYGRRCLATGGNAVAARFSGVNTRMITFSVLTVMGAAAGLAGMLYAGRLHSGLFGIGQDDNLSVIAAVILGGTSLFGGRATVVGTIVASLLIGVINNGLILLGLQYAQQLVVRGAIIVLAVALSRRH
jgi:ribose transport system permease protein